MNITIISQAEQMPRKGMNNDKNDIWFFACQKQDVDLIKVNIKRSCKLKATK